MELQKIAIKVISTLANWNLNKFRLETFNMLAFYQK
jgi:hypothetical protein